MTQPAARQVPAARQPSPAGRLTAVPTDQLPPIYTIAEAARLLRVPEGWLRKKVTAGAVPHTRLGKHVRFTADHLRRIVAAGEAQPATRQRDNLQGLSPRSRRTQIDR